MAVLLINCDKTYSLDTVEDFVKRANTSEQNIPIEQRYCNVSELQAVSEEVRRRQLLCGVFVVNAYESRLSINEDKAGIGYAVLYRALRDAAQGRVLVVIGGDDRYKDGEQDKSVLSTWAYHKIAAQFDDTYLDGRRGFVFSWDERHNPVHEEALRGYFEAISEGKPGLENVFTPTCPTGPLPSSELSQPPTKPTDRTRPGHPGLQQPVAPRVPLQPQKPSTSRQATTLQSTQTEAHGDIVPQQKTFQLSQLQVVSEEVRRRQLLCGVFVVNAYESRLSINEDKAGIGYAVLYKALLEAAQGRVLVVIGGDDRYKDGEQDKSVLSTWAYHKIAAQFDDTYLDGRRGFVFSWDVRHNQVHEQALESYLRAISDGKPGLENAFTPTRPTGPQPSSKLSQPPTKPTDRTRPGHPGPHQQLTSMRPTGPLSSLEPSRSSTTSTDRRQTPPTDTTQGFHTDGQAGLKNREHQEVKHSDSKRTMAPYFTHVNYNDEEKRCIQEKLQERQKQVKAEGKHREIKFVGYLLEGKLVPGFGTFHGDLPPDFPGFMKKEIAKTSANMKMAAAIVFDDKSSKNCLTVRDLNNSDISFVKRKYREVVNWFTGSK
ncbi:Hypp3688 [Branchiostoma lanceolatum]|uniref:Hypp3688 protein n=1 Tax=Branchiostoma lanceolatum TaxID=7740 RepID=A0A8K0A608_BRALA|nr:Hypp3688 [Branchiostoma lanceolatum]